MLIVLPQLMNIQRWIWYFSKMWLIWFHSFYSEQMQSGHQMTQRAGGIAARNRNIYTVISIQAIPVRLRIAIIPVLLCISVSSGVPDHMNHPMHVPLCAYLYNCSSKEPGKKYTCPKCGQHLKRSQVWSSTICDCKSVTRLKGLAGWLGLALFGSLGLRLTWLIRLTLCCFLGHSNWKCFFIRSIKVCLTVQRSCEACKWHFPCLRCWLSTYFEFASFKLVMHTSSTSFCESSLAGSSKPISKFLFMAGSADAGKNMWPCFGVWNDQLHFVAHLNDCLSVLRIKDRPLSCTLLIRYSPNQSLHLPARLLEQFPERTSKLPNYKVVSIDSFHVVSLSWHTPMGFK